MPYVDRTYYLDTFKGEPVDEADFLSLCNRAGEIIEMMTAYKVTPITVPGDAGNGTGSSENGCLCTD